VPLMFTVELLTKFVPFTVRANAPEPAITVEGCSEAAVGVGLLMVSVRALDVPPPGVGLVTVMEAVPAAAMSPAKIAAVSWVALT